MLKQEVYMYMCDAKTRSQHVYLLLQALKDQRRVVTAFWLNDVLVKKKMAPPWQALHLPIIYNEEKPCNNQVRNNVSICDRKCSLPGKLLSS